VTRAVIGSVASWAWLDQTGFGPVAFLLLARPEGEPEELEELADALALAPPGRKLPDIGADRVGVAGATRVKLRLDGCVHRIEVSVGERWARFVERGGPVAVLVGLEPLARGAGAEAVEAYVGECVAGDRMRLGVAGCVGPGPLPVRAGSGLGEGRLEEVGEEGRAGAVGVEIGVVDGEVEADAALRAHQGP